MSPHPKIAPHRGIAAILAEWGRGTIYRSAYIALSNGRGTPISHTNAESLIAGAWYPKMASITLSLTSTELANPSDVLGYTCSCFPTLGGSGQAGQWKCGCQASAWTQSYCCARHSLRGRNRYSSLRGREGTH
jgi:hypothetical protein